MRRQGQGVIKTGSLWTCGFVSLLSLVKALEQYPVNFCTTYGNACDRLQSKFQCPDPVKTVGCEGPTAATGHPTYPSYDGQCKCGTLDVQRLEQEIIFHEIDRANTKSPVVITDASGAVDFCSSYTKSCQAVLDAIACPTNTNPSLQVNQACSMLGNYSSFANQCTCGGIDASLEARNSIINYMMRDKVEALSTRDGQYVQLCPTFTDICDGFLNGISCPANQRQNVGCAVENYYNTYVGKCMCGTIDMGDRVRRLVIDQYIGPKIEMISNSFINTDGTLDFCNTFTWSCDQWLNEVIQCPIDMAVNENNCGGASGTEIQNFNGRCTCGNILASQRIIDIIVDTQMNPDISRLSCGTNGACHPIKDIFLTKNAKVSGGGIFGILITILALVIVSGAFLPQIWTCSRNSD